MKLIIQKKGSILFLAVFIGILITFQSRSFSGISSIYSRDIQSNPFAELKLLKDKNEDLQAEINDIELLINQLSDQNMALKAIDDEIKKYQKLSGNTPIFGPGIIITIEGSISTAWMTDLVNGLFRAGAEAISINKIRLVNNTIGFDTLPLGQILLNGSILSPSYVFEVIGDPNEIITILELPGEIFDRLAASYPNLVFKVEKKEYILMK